MVLLRLTPTKLSIWRPLVVFCTAPNAYKIKHLTSFDGVTALNAYKFKHLTSFGGVTALNVLLLVLLPLKPTELSI